MMFLPPNPLRRQFIRLAIGGIVELVVSVTPSALAQRPNPTTISPKSAQGTKSFPAEDAPTTFFSHFSTFAKQGKVTVVAEDVPLHLMLTPEEKKLLNEAEGEALPRKRIEKEAALFDYETQWLNSDVLLLKKKYTNPKDFPFVTLSEAKRTLDYAERTIKPFSADYEMPASLDLKPAFNNALISLTENQLALMKQANLPTSTLTPGQRQQMWNVLVNLYIDKDALLTVQSGQSDLKFVSGPDGFLSASAGGPNRKFVFARPAVNNPVSKFNTIPLCYEKGRYRTAFGGGIRFPKLNADGNEIPFYDASEPEPIDLTIAAEQTEAHKNESVVLLNTLATQLNQSAAGKETYAVDDVLKNKPVTIFGRENTTRAALFNAAASVYGLRVVPAESDPSGKNTFMTTLAAFKARSLADASRAVRSILPAPYLRALHLPEMNLAYDAADKAKAERIAQENARNARRARGEVVPEPVETEAEKQARKEAKEKASASWTKWADAPDTLEQAAFRRLRATVEPRVKASPDGRVPFSELTRAEEAAFTTAIMRIALDGLQNFCLAKQQSYIERFDQLVLSGGPYLDSDDHKPYIELQFGFTRADGSFDSKAGVARIPYKGAGKAELAGP